MEKINLLELRATVFRLMMCRNIEDSCELLDIYSNFLLSSIDYHDKLDFSSQEEADAAMISQMIFTKILHLKSAVSGITYSNNTGVKLNRIIDPTVVVSLVRNIFETVGLFNLMFRATDNRDFRYIIYLLWVLSGLKYRQRFEQQAIMEENLNKIAQEKQDIDNIIDEIRNSKIYLEQGDSEKSVIEQAIKEKKYLLHFNGDKIEILHWQRLTETMEIKEGLFDNFYSYFSLYAHPTNVSVFQYADMFKREEMTFLDLTNFNLKITAFLGGIFIADYINLFPKLLVPFEKLSIKDQVIINCYSTIPRDDSYEINDAKKYCE